MLVSKKFSISEFQITGSKENFQLKGVLKKDEDPRCSEFFFILYIFYTALPLRSLEWVLSVGPSLLSSQQLCVVGEAKRE